MEIQLVLNLVRRAMLSWYCDQSLSSPTKFCSARTARNLTREKRDPLARFSILHNFSSLCARDLRLKIRLHAVCAITEENYVLYCDQQLVHDALRERMLTGNERIKVDALKKVSTDWKQLGGLDREEDDRHELGPQFHQETDVKGATSQH